MRKDGSKPAGRKAFEAPPIPPPHELLPPLPPPSDGYEPILPEILGQPSVGLGPYHMARARQILVERAERKISALVMYQALPVQFGFHRSESRINILRGGVRSGKTLAAAVEVARAACGMDPFNKYPKENGRCFCVGKDLRHIGEVMWRKLGRGGQGGFKIIRDRDTCAWRAFRPEDPGDTSREGEAKFAPPLIPRRLIDTIAWQNKRLSIPSKVTLRNGWELSFFSSEGKPPQGSDLDLIWFDEEICDPDWFPEMISRILDRHGRFIWSATPQAGTEVLYELHERAYRERYQPFPSVREHVILIKDNPHIDDEEKQALASNLDPEQRRVRIEGEFAFISFRVYPEFNMLIHGVDDFEIPSDWTRYIVIDPGHAVCAVLFAAVPPDGSHVYIYDELYIEQCDAAKFAMNLYEKAKHTTIQACIIDPNMALSTDSGTGKTVGQQYSTALEAVGFEAAGTRTGFIPGCDNIESGLLAVHGWLRVREDGLPYLRILRGRCPSLEHEFKNYARKRVSGKVTDAPNQRRHSHGMDCFDQETEVLTRSGWKRFADSTLEDEYATVNLETDAIEYQYATERIEHDHDGEMVLLGGYKLNGLVTPNHRMVVYPQGKARPVIKEAHRLVPSDRIKLHASWEGKDQDVVLIPAAGRQGEDVEVDAGDWAEFLGWYIAEGTCCKPQMPGRGYQVVISQKKPDGVAALKELLGRFPWRWNRWECGFRINSCRQLWEQLVGLGLQHERRVPGWIKEASPRLIDRFLAGAVFGDGWVEKGRRSYATVSQLLADDIQELFIKVGASASVRNVVRNGWNIEGRSGSCRPQYWVSEWTVPHGLLRDSKGKPNYEMIQYAGKVYCVSVPNGTLIVRRNGKPMIAGNCLRYLALFNPRYVKPAVKKAPPCPAVRSLRRKHERQRQVGGGESFVNLGPGGFIGARQR